MERHTIRFPEDSLYTEKLHDEFLERQVGVFEYQNILNFTTYKISSS